MFFIVFHSLHDRFNHMSARDASYCPGCLRAMPLPLPFTPAPHGTRLQHEVPPTNNPFFSSSLAEGKQLGVVIIPYVCLFSIKID